MPCRDEPVRQRIRHRLQAFSSSTRLRVGAVAASTPPGASVLSLCDEGVVVAQLGELTGVHLSKTGRQELRLDASPVS
jgi:hypothetical protein